MSARPHVPWALASPAISHIVDDEAPTSFYPRRRSAKLRTNNLAQPPVQPPTSPPRAPRSRPPASPVTLLLPTGGPREVTSDGTILLPLSNDNHRAHGDRVPRLGALAEFFRSLRQATMESPALRGYGLLTSAIALGLIGVLAVTYAYVATSDRARQRELSAAHASSGRDSHGADSLTAASFDRDRGFIEMACDLSRRLVQAQEDSRSHHAEP